MIITWKSNYFYLSDQVLNKYLILGEHTYEHTVRDLLVLTMVQKNYT